MKVWIAMVVCLALAGCSGAAREQSEEIMQPAPAQESTASDDGVDAAPDDGEAAPDDGVDAVSACGGMEVPRWDEYVSALRDQLIEQGASEAELQETMDAQIGGICSQIVGLQTQSDCDLLAANRSANEERLEGWGEYYRVHSEIWIELIDWRMAEVGC